MPPVIGAIGAIGSSIGAAAAATPGLTALTAIGTGLSVLGTVASARQDYGSERANAKAAQIEAKQHLEQANEMASRRRRQAESDTSTQIAKFGASGIDILGSPLDVIMYDRSMGELAARDIEYEGRMQAAGKQYESKLRNWRARQIGPSAAISIGGTLVKGARTVLGG